MMIVESRDIREFVQAAQGKSYEDILVMAESEATSAERLMYRQRHRVAPRTPPGTRYAGQLKRFISFMRYGIRPAGIDAEQLDIYRDLRRSALERPVRRS